MPSFEDYAKRFIVGALQRTPADEAADVYVVSLLVYDEEDDDRLPTVTVGFNTESHVAEQDPDDPEVRWNYAMWLQNELGILGEEEQDPEGAALREAWLRERGLWYDDEDEEDIE